MSWNTYVHQNACLVLKNIIKGKKCEGEEINCEKCNRKFYGEKCFKNHLKNQSKVDNKSDTVCDSVKKCSKCERIITGKYVNLHKCGYKECTNCGKYVDKDQKCYLKKIKVKGGNCTLNKNNPWKINESMKKKDWCFSCRSYTEKYTQNTGTHEVNLAMVLDYDGNEYIYKNIDDFCKNMINDKF